MKVSNVSVTKKIRTETLYQILFTKKVQHLYKRKFNNQFGVQHNHTRIVKSLEQILAKEQK